jgi:RNA-directed DNA polymerase
MIYAAIARDLGLSPTFVRNVAISAHHRYKIYTIPKRRGGRRTICHPAKELKLLQRWLVDELLVDLPVHDSALAYRVGIGIGRIAKRHSGSRYYLRMDFMNFFESIRKRDIKFLLEHNWGWFKVNLPKADIDRIAQIVCRGQSLTIGAPSSPVLSNAVMYQFDTEISLLCNELGCVYSRYADDLFFSTNNGGVLERIESEVTRILAGLRVPKLKINDSKTFHSSKKHRVRFLGMILTPSGEVSVGREKKREIKSLVFRFSQGKLDDELVQYLRGYLAFLNSVEPSFLGSLKAKYSDALVDAIIHE